MLHGSCLCGRIRYVVEGELGPLVHCHCQTCRKAHAAAFNTAARVKRSGFRWVAGEEELRSYESTPGKKRYFCGNCGSHLVAAWSNEDDVIVRIGSLDDDPGGRPVLHIWTSMKAPWFEITDGLRQIAEATPKL